MFVSWTFGGPRARAGVRPREGRFGAQMSGESCCHVAVMDFFCVCQCRSSADVRWGEGAGGLLYS